MKIFISVISHHHHDVIINLNSLNRIAKIGQIEVVVRDNLPVSKLNTFCLEHKIHYLPNEQERGFSENNNLNYLYCVEELGMRPTDYFILMNPDILITQHNIPTFMHEVFNCSAKLCVANLFLDQQEIAQDDNLRYYPKLSNFFKNYLFNDRSTVIKRNQALPEKAEYWGSGSFLCIKSSLYQELNGFDERYHMYCEDIDFCYRAAQIGVLPQYLPNLKAVHFRRRDSKRFLTKYFFWHVQSVFLYILSAKGWRKMKSCLKVEDKR